MITQNTRLLMRSLEDLQSRVRELESGQKIYEPCGPALYSGIASCERRITAAQVFRLLERLALDVGYMLKWEPSTTAGYTLVKLPELKAPKTK